MEQHDSWKRLSEQQLTLIYKDDQWGEAGVTISMHHPYQHISGCEREACVIIRRVNWQTLWDSQAYWGASDDYRSSPSPFKTQQRSKVAIIPYIFYNSRYLLWLFHKLFYSSLS